MKLAFRILLAGLLARAFLAPAFELLPEEAFHWTWAEHPDWCYDDHPPMAAWWIVGSTALFGDAEWAVRLPFVLAGFATGWIVAVLAARRAGSRAAAWAAALWTVTPLFAGSSLLAMLEGPLLLFWALTLLGLDEALSCGRTAGWYVAGFACGAAFLSKFTGVALPVAVALAVAASPAARAAVRLRHAFGAALLAAAVAAPVVWWNATHDWSAFLFQTAGRSEDLEGWKPAQVAIHVGGQMLAIGPVLYVLTWFEGLRRARRRDLDASDAVLVAAALLPLVLFLAISTRSVVKINWAAPGYIAGLVLVVRRWAPPPVGSTARRGRKLPIALIAWPALLLAAGVVHLVHPIPRAIAWQPGYWRGLAESVGETADRYDATLVVGDDDYRMASELSYYLRRRGPEPPPVTAANAFLLEGLSFKRWFDPADFRGATAVVVREGHPDRDLGYTSQFFGSFERVEVLPAPSARRKVLVFVGRDYRIPDPPPPPPPSSGER